MSTYKYNNVFYFVEKYSASAQSPDNEIIASNKKFPGLYSWLQKEKLCLAI